MDRDRRDPRRPGPGGIVLAVAGGALALLVLAYASQPQVADDASTTTSNLVSSPPEMTTTSTRVVVASDPSSSEPLTDYLPAADGASISVVATRSGGNRLMTWSDLRSGAAMPAMLNRPLLEFDASDLRLAFIAPSSTLDGDRLYVGRRLDWRPIASQVTSFAWHTTSPGRLGWVEIMRGLCHADLHINGAFVTEPVCDQKVTGELVGLDDNGALLLTGGEAVRVSRDGSEGARLAAIDGFLAPDGRVLITSISSAEQGVVFDLASPDLSEVDILDWAPADASGQNGFVAWSPRVTSPELAFLVRLDAGRYQIQRWDLDGNLLNALDLDGEVWNVGWDRSGRYLLAPGLMDGEFGVQAFDLTTSEWAFLPFDHRVQDTHLVIPALCEDASALADHWQQRVPDGVTVVDMWLVNSRDSGLSSWWSVSGRLIGGEHDGAIATWAIPDYSGVGTPPDAIPANHAAAAPGRKPSSLDPGGYDVDDWMLVDGARISQWCVGASGD